MPKQIVGSVYWIEKNRQTSRVVDVSEAFSDPAQAVTQILYAERSGDKKQLRLARFAYRQFQGKRYRVESKAKRRRATEVDQERISMTSRKKPSKGRPSKKGVETAVVRKAPKVAFRSLGNELSRAKSPAKATRKKAARKALTIASKSSRSESSKAKPSEPVGRKAARKTLKVASTPSRGGLSNGKSAKKTARGTVSTKVVSWLASAFSKRKPSDANPSRNPMRKGAGRKTNVGKAERNSSNRK